MGHGLKARVTHTNRTLFEVLAAALLLGSMYSSTSDAVTYQYRLDFDGSVAGKKGEGTFYWDDVTQRISNFTWKFGGGYQGGLDDSKYDFWDSPLYGGTYSTFLFEILTGEDVHPSTCADGCGDGFGAAVLINTLGNNFVRDTSPTLVRQYYFWVSDATTTDYEGSFDIKKIKVPEPGSLVLLSLGLLGLGVTAWRRPQ